MKFKKERRAKRGFGQEVNLLDKELRNIQFSIDHLTIRYFPYGDETMPDEYAKHITSLLERKHEILKRLVQISKTSKK